MKSANLHMQEQDKLKKNSSVKFIKIPTDFSHLQRCSIVNKIFIEFIKQQIYSCI